MNRQTKLWQALLAAILAGLGTYLGTRPGEGQPQPPAPAKPPILDEFGPKGVPPQPADPPPVAPRPAEAKPDPVAAIGQIQFGNAGCTATVIGPRRPSGHWDVLTAAHCVQAVGQHGRFKFKDGRTTGVVVVALDRRSDCAWLVTESIDAFPFALLADRDPPVGAKVWHMGYGVHIPGNCEDGTVTALPNPDGQVEFRLSVSSGDSGGGIALDADGRIVGAVCCTTARGQVARVWACGPVTAAKLRAQKVDVADEWTPVEIPLVPDRVPIGAEWTPIDMPVVVVPDVMPATRRDRP